MIHCAQVSINSPRGCLDPHLYARIDAPRMARRPWATYLYVTPIVAWPPIECGEQLVKPTTPVMACVGFLVSRGAPGTPDPRHTSAAPCSAWCELGGSHGPEDRDPRPHPE